MSTELVHILGAGGHGRVVVDALQLLGHAPESIRVRDDRVALHGQMLLGCRIESPMLPETLLVGWVHAAIGVAATRQRLLQQSGVLSTRWLTVVHPRAVLAASATVGSGSLLAAQSVVGPCAQLGHGVIVNHGAVVDHDCQVGDFGHIAPCVSLGGGVVIGQRVLIGAGARILPGVRIGDDVVIGAGAVVLSDVPAGQTWTGLPARPAKKENE